MSTELASSAAIPAQVATRAGLRAVYLALGVVFTGLGIIGALVPLMPSTIFLIIAAWFYGRSSARLENWLLTHPRFGPILVAWRLERAIPRRAKVLAASGMALGFILFVVGAHPGPWLLIGVAAAMSACALYVLTRPEPSGRG